MSPRSEGEGFPYRDEIFLEYQGHDVFRALWLDQGHEQRWIAALLGRGGLDRCGRGLRPTACRVAEAGRAEGH